MVIDVVEICSRICHQTAHALGAVASTAMCIQNAQAASKNKLRGMERKAGNQRMFAVAWGAAAFVSVVSAGCHSCMDSGFMEIEIKYEPAALTAPAPPVPPAPSLQQQHYSEPRQR